MPARFDVAVIGLGIMGSAASSMLARAGYSVLGIEQGPPAHPGGSSGGESRMFRRIYEDDDEYAALTLAARRRWLALQEETGQLLFLETGGLTAGLRDSERLQTQIVSAERHGAGYRLLDQSALRRSYPTLSWPSTVAAVYDPMAGVLLAEACVRAFISDAIYRGGTMVFGESVDLLATLETWAERRAIHVHDVAFAADRLVFAVGPWAVEIACRWPTLELTLEATSSHWFDPAQHAAALRPTSLPHVTWCCGEEEVCMFPDLGTGIKVKTHHTGRPGRLTDLGAPVTCEEQQGARRLLKELSGLDLALLRSVDSLYTNAPGRKFYVERHPSHGDCVVVSACSGHGFKFAPMIADRVVAQIAE